MNPAPGVQRDADSTLRIPADAGPIVVALRWAALPKPSYPAAPGALTAATAARIVDTAGWSPGATAPQWVVIGTSPSLTSCSRPAARMPRPGSWSEQSMPLPG